jgi:aminomethyltransferase
MPSPGITAIFFVDLTGQKVSQLTELSSLDPAGALNPDALGYNRNSMDSVAEVNSSPAGADAGPELSACIAGCGIYRPSRDLFSVTGRDRVRWFNGMVTNNIRDLGAGDGVYAFVLNSQGHILGDLHIFNRGEDLVAEIDAPQSENLLQILKRYIIMDKVEITSLADDLAIIGVTGQNSAAALAASGIAAELPVMKYADVSYRDKNLSVVRLDNPSVPSYEIWAPRGELETLWRSLLDAGAMCPTPDTLETVRVLCGIPRVGQDVRERVLPQETGQDRALNFTKGCYIGQEIVERVRSRGHLHRTISGFEIAGGAVLSGTKIQSAGRDVGEITTVAPMQVNGLRLALGFIRKEALIAGESLTVADASLTPATLPFLDLIQELRRETH